MVTGAEVKAEPENHATGQWSNFPAGLRLLVVDDDPLCLKVVEQMLRRCNYIGECGRCPSEPGKKL